MKRCIWLLLSLALVLVLGIRSPAHAESPVLKVVYYEEPPYQFISEKGKANGLLVEFFDAIAQKCGYTAEYYQSGQMCSGIELGKCGRCFGHAKL